MLAAVEQDSEGSTLELDDHYVLDVCEVAYIAACSSGNAEMADIFYNRISLVDRNRRTSSAQVGSVTATSSLVEIAGFIGAYRSGNQQLADQAYNRINLQLHNRTNDLRQRLLEYYSLPTIHEFLETI